MEPVEPLRGATMYCSGEGDGRFIKWQWACFDQPVHVQSLIKALEASAPAASREAVSEAQLRKRLRQYLPLISAAAEEVAEREGVDLLPDDDDATWLVSGHPYLGMRVATKHASKGKDVTAIGTIMRWLPAGEDAQEDPALFHMDHADGDGEDLEAHEVIQAVAAFGCMTAEEVGAAVQHTLDKSAVAKYENTSAKRGLRAAAYGELSVEKLKAELIDLEESLRSGLKSAGSVWEAGGGSRSERSRWLSRIKRASEVKDVAAVCIELEATLHALQAADETSERPPWRTLGHEWVGKPGRRFFIRETEDDGKGEAAAAEDEPADMGHLMSDGRIVAWLPAEGDDPPLWHMVHHDGDEEDLEEYEAAFAIGAAGENRLEPNALEVEYLQRMKEKAEEEEARRAAEEESEGEEEESEEEEEEEEDDDDESDDDDEGGRRRRGGKQAAPPPSDSFPHAGSALLDHTKLWRSSEARARWTAAMKSTESFHMLTLGLACLKQHALAYSALQECKPHSSKRRELSAVLEAWYHAGAFQTAAKPSKSAAGKAVRFTPQEEKWLREGHALFHAKFGEGGRGRGGASSWYQRTLERFAFHPSRTAQSLRQKWQVMGGGRK